MWPFTCMWCGWTSKGAGPKSSSAATGCLGHETCSSASRRCLERRDVCQPGAMGKPQRHLEVAASIEAGTVY